MVSFFPRLTSTGSAPSSREIVATYRQEFSKRVAEGSLRPLVLPYHFYGLFLLVIYLYIPHTKRPYLYASRWLVLGVITAFQWKTLWEASSQSMAVAYATGLISTWGVVESVTWLVLYRPQFDSKRVERRVLRGADSRDTVEHSKTTIKDRSISGADETHQNGFTGGSEDESLVFRRRPQANVYGNRETADCSSTQKENSTADQDSEDVEYYWQSYPDDLSQRIPWLLDHLVNFRGPGWNWAIPPLPSLPPYIKLDGHGNEASRVSTSSIGLQYFSTRRALIESQAPRFVVGYLILDVVKTIMMKDPYFTFGPTTYAPPQYLHSLSPMALRIFRQSISAAGVLVSLEMVFLLAPILFCLLLGPKVLGLRGEPWQYSTTWGSFSNIMNKGLNGLWGSWWHH